MVSLKEMYVFARCIRCSCVNFGGCVVHLLAQKMKCLDIMLLRNGFFPCSSLDRCCIKTFDWSSEYCVCVCVCVCVHWHFYCQCPLLVGLVLLVHVGCAKKHLNIMVVWVLTWWSVVDWQWCFGGICCLCLRST